MRYEDGPEASASIEVNAERSVLWALATDISLPARFSDEFQGAEWLDGVEAPTLGARFAGHNENPHLGAWDVTCTVVEFEEGARFGWVVGNVAAPAAAWRYEIEGASGALRLTHWGRIGPGPSGLTPMIEANPESEAALIEMRLAMWQQNMVATVEGIRALAEGDQEVRPHLDASKGRSWRRVNCQNFDPEASER
jgi:Polyketide cyclase / dehydrase and lipid transport